MRGDQRLALHWLQQVAQQQPDRRCRGAQALSAALGSGALPNLTSLYLGWNQIGDAGMSAFATALGNGALPQLERLHLANNHIGDAGAVAIAGALKVNPSMYKLSLRLNEIRDAGAIATVTSMPISTPASKPNFDSTRRKSPNT